MGRRGSFLLAAGLALAVFMPGMSSAHEERHVEFPSGDGSVPRYRKSGPRIVVCKDSTPRRIRNYPGRLRKYNSALYRECQRSGFNNIQAAVNAVRRKGTRILVQPGVYRERPSLRRLRGECRELKGQNPLTYRQQKTCPHVQNLIGIFGDGPDDNTKCDRRLCDLQIEGTGRRRHDVLLDGRFKRLNVLRADRADGIYLRNFAVQHAKFNGVYVLQTDGFVIDRLVGRWTDEYGFLTFASDHGLYKRCEAFGNGDSGVYPGSAAPHHGARTSIEIRRCSSHHNALGYSGTAGDSTYVHHNRFFKNGTGAVMDSFFPDHPGLPQNSAVFKNNRIYSNNQDYYRYWRNGTCDKPSAERGYKRGVVCPTIPAPVGTGVLVAGGNANLFGSNWIYDNWRYGTMQFWVPASVRGEEDPDKQYDTSHFNRYVGNWMGLSPGGRSLPNGLDFWWDEEGAGNCWQENVSPGGITSDPPVLPDCDQMPVNSPGNAAKQAALVPCATYSTPDNTDPAGCDWLRRPPKPARR